MNHPSPLATLPDLPRFSVTLDDAPDGVLGAAHFSGIFGIPGGEDRSPAIAWDGAPTETQSFAVTIFDADAPTGAGFWHWAVYDIPAGTTSLPAGAGTPGSTGLPAGAKQLPNDARAPRYVGAAPQPGSGPHRYFAIVHALSVPTLSIPVDATPTFLTFVLGDVAIGRGVAVAEAEL
ncbi:Raf kinase inhibitor-like YbhB/YbcL family protein [Leifsonia sp. 563]|uniref:YbhB/YbcL family Raf kinase inhibitor-like protein n=1 Tax=Leifsonia sp. 563 TaxID=3156412 RepID=UPI00339A81EF